MTKSNIAWITIIIFSNIITGCVPSESSIQTAIVKTESAIQTLEPISTSTSILKPTNTKTETEALADILPSITVDKIITNLKSNYGMYCSEPSLTEGGFYISECKINPLSLESLFGFNVTIYSPDNHSIKAISIITVTYDTVSSINFGIGSIEEIVSDDQFQFVNSKANKWIGEKLRELTTSNIELEFTEEFDGIYYKVLGESNSYLLFIAAVPLE